MAHSKEKLIAYTLSLFFKRVQVFDALCHFPSMDYHADCHGSKVYSVTNYKSSLLHSQIFALSTRQVLFAFSLSLYRMYRGMGIVSCM